MSHYQYMYITQISDCMMGNSPTSTVKICSSKYSRIQIAGEKNLLSSVFLGWMRQLNILLPDKRRLQRHKRPCPHLFQTSSRRGEVRAKLTARGDGKTSNCKANICRVKGEPSHLRASCDGSFYTPVIYTPEVKRSAASDSSAKRRHGSLWNTFHVQHS